MSARAAEDLILIEFTVRGSPSTVPDFPPDPRLDIAVVGCVVSEYLEVLSIFTPELFRTGPVTCLIGREQAEPNRIILPGDELTLTRSS